MSSNGFRTYITDNDLWKSHLKNYLSNVIFKEFCRVKSTDDYLKDEYMPLFYKAFMHESFRPEDKNALTAPTNYEYLEFIGDKSINNLVTNYIIDYYPCVADQNWITKLYNRFVSENTYSYIGENILKFSKFILIGDRDYEIIMNMGGPTLDNKAYFKIVEDVFEALMGAIFLVTQSVNQKKKKTTIPIVGTSCDILNMIIWKCFNQIPFPAISDVIVDSISHMKEVVAAPNIALIEGNQYKNALFFYTETEKKMVFHNGTMILKEVFIVSGYIPLVRQFAGVSSKGEPVINSKVISPDPRAGKFVYKIKSSNLKKAQFELAQKIVDYIKSVGYYIPIKGIKYYEHVPPNIVNVERFNKQQQEIIDQNNKARMMEINVQRQLKQQIQDLKRRNFNPMLKKLYGE
jgi:dsRNA-specific ribonuclease